MTGRPGTSGTTLRNELSWSFSRHQTLATCERRYWYRHYGHWGGWEAEATDPTREVYRLTKLEDRATWQGRVIHATIARILRRARAGRPVTDVEAVVADVRDGMRADFAASRSDVARKTGRFKHHVRFFEHEEGLDDGGPAWRQRWKDSADTVEAALRLFFRSRLYRRLAALPEQDWLEIEDPDAAVGASFQHDGVTLHVKVDCAFRDDGVPTVIDWKTGRGRSELTSVQLAGYALYLSQRHELPPETVRAREVNVVTGAVVEHEVGAEALATFRQTVTASMARMRSLLVDVEGNVARPAGDFAFAPDERDCRYCHFRSLCPRVAAEF